MATVLSLPRLPVESPSLSVAASSRFFTSQCSVSSSRQPIWTAFASDRRSISCDRATGSSSSYSYTSSSSFSSWIGVVERNVGLDTSVRCCSSEEHGDCTTSGFEIAGEEEDESGPGPGRRRRELLFGAAVFGINVIAGGSEAQARDRRNRKEISPDDYLTSDTGLKYYDVEPGKGTLAERGEIVVVHFDCLYRSITAVSSRESKILAGNRTIAEPYELTVGAVPGRERKRDFVENANGLFSAQASPKPPPALYSITEGMRVGGKRTVIVTPDFGYGQRGLNEIPPGATFDLNIELLEVKKPQNENGSK